MLPPITDRRWHAVVSSKVRHDYEFLALQIYLGRISIKLASDASPQSLESYARELRELLEKNAHLPSVKRDLAKIFGGAS